MSIPYETLQELYEIADGARGDGPWMRGLAIEHIRKNGHEYPAREDTSSDALQDRGGK